MTTTFFNRLFITLVSICVFCSLPFTTAFADDYPSRTINMVVPWKAGGGTDSFARAIAADWKSAMSVPLAIINKPGASGITGARGAAQAKPDGYTIMLTSGGTFLLKTILSEQPVDPFESFEIVAQVGELKPALMVPADSPFKTVQDLIKEAKEKPGELRWAHSGPGSYPNVSGLGFLKKNEIDAKGIPFKGGAPVRAALLGNQVDFAFLGVQQVIGFEEGIRVLGVASTKRDSVMSDIQTFKELDVPFIGVSSPVVLFAPKGTPDEIIKTLSVATEKIIAGQTFKDLIGKRGLAPVFLSSSEAEAKLSKMKEEITPILADDIKK